MYHVAVRTASKCQIEIAVESNQVGESVMLAVMENPADIGDFYFRKPDVCRLCRETELMHKQGNRRNKELPAWFIKGNVCESIHYNSFPVCPGRILHNCERRIKRPVPKKHYSFLSMIV